MDRTHEKCRVDLYTGCIVKSSAHSNYRVIYYTAGQRAFITLSLRNARLFDFYDFVCLCSIYITRGVSRFIDRIVLTFMRLMLLEEV